MHANAFFGNLKNAYAFHTAGGAGEVLVDGLGVYANRLEQLRTAVAHIRRHAHFGHDFGQALANRLDVVVDGFVRTQITRQVFVNSLQRFHREVGMHGFRTVARQNRKVVHFAGRTGFNHQTGCRTQTFTHQMLVNGRQRQQSRNRHLRRRHKTVADDQNIVAAFDGVYRLRAE